MLRFNLRDKVRVPAWLAAVLPALAGCGPYAIDRIDFPGAKYTEAWGVNNKREIVGTYFFGTGPLAQHSFIRSPQGQYTTIDYPQSNDTHAYKINDQSQVVGTTPGRSWLREGQFAPQPLPIPASFTGAQAFGIEIFIVGSYTNFSIVHGFLDEANNVKTYDRPDGFLTVLTCTNGKGEVAGYFQGQDNRTHGFKGDAAGNSLAIDPPGSNHTEFWGMNNQGKLVGWYLDGTRLVGFVRETNGSIVEISLGTGPTYVNDVNEAGEIVGSFSDATGTHGFLGTPN